MHPTRHLPAVALLALPAMALAVPVDFMLDAAGPGVNRADFQVDAVVPILGSITVNDSTDVSGTVAADVGFDGLLPDSLEFLPGTDLGLTDVSISLGLIPVASSTGVRGTLSGGPLVVSPTGLVDLAGTTLTLDEGFVSFIGDDPANNDLAGNPIVLTLPANSLATLASTPLGGDDVALVLSGPITFQGQVDDDPQIDLTVSANLLARGTATIPEPATLGLLTATGLTLLRRR